MSQKKQLSVSASLEAFLEGARFQGADLIRVAMARRLAAAADDAPPHALARIAVELDRLLAELQWKGATVMAGRAADRILDAAP